MVQVLLDSSFLLNAKGAGFDVFAHVQRLLDERIENAEYVLPSPVKSELLNKGFSKHMLEQMMKTHGIALVQMDGEADDVLVSEAEKRNAIVCTNDIPLAKRIRDSGCKVISFLGRSKLILR